MLGMRTYGFKFGIIIAFIQSESSSCSKSAIECYHYNMGKTSFLMTPNTASSTCVGLSPHAMQLVLHPKISLAIRC